MLEHLPWIKPLKSVRLIEDYKAHSYIYHLVYENCKYRMEHISSEWFYDSILLKYPPIVFKYRSWFEHVKGVVQKICDWSLARRDGKVKLIVRMEKASNLLMTIFGLHRKLFEFHQILSSKFSKTLKMAVIRQYEYYGIQNNWTIPT